MPQQKTCIAILLAAIKRGLLLIHTKTVIAIDIFLFIMMLSFEVVLVSVGTVVCPVEVKNRDIKHLSHSSSVNNQQIKIIETSN
jgi:hypothetical protein